MTEFERVFSQTDEDAENTLLHRTASIARILKEISKIQKSFLEISRNLLFDCSFSEMR